MNHHINIICFLSLFILTNAISAKSYKMNLLKRKLNILVLNPTHIRFIKNPIYNITKNINVYEYIYDNDDNIDAFIKNRSINLIRTDSDFVTCKK